MGMPAVPPPPGASEGEHAAYRAFMVRMLGYDPAVDKDPGFWRSLRRYLFG